MFTLFDGSGQEMLLRHRDNSRNMSHSQIGEPVHDAEPQAFASSPARRA